MSLLIFIPMLIEISLNLNNVSVIANAMYYAITQICYLCKLINFMLNQKNLKTLEDFLTSTTFNQHNTKAEDDFIKNVIKQSKIMSYAFKSGIVALCILYYIYPHFESDDALVLPGWYPLNTAKYRTEIIVTQVLSVGFSAHNNATLDLLNYIFIMLGSAQLEVLMEKLVKVYEFDKDTNKEEQTKMTLKRICDCIKHHQKIIE